LGLSTYPGHKNAGAAGNPVKKCWGYPPWPAAQAMRLTAAQPNSVQHRLEKAEQILGWSAKQLCLEGPEERLSETKYCQPIMLLGREFPRMQGEIHKKSLFSIFPRFPATFPLNQSIETLLSVSRNRGFMDKRIDIAQLRMLTGFREEMMF